MEVKPEVITLLRTGSFYFAILYFFLDNTNKLMYLIKSKMGFFLTPVGRVILAAVLPITIFIGTSLTRSTIDQVRYSRKENKAEYKRHFVSCIFGIDLILILGGLSASLFTIAVVVLKDKISFFDFFTLSTLCIIVIIITFISFFSLAINAGPIISEETAMWIINSIGVGIWTCLILFILRELAKA